MTEHQRGSGPSRPPVLAECVLGDALCKVRLFSDAQWEALPEADRPAAAERVEGLGWVVATPGRLRRAPDA